MEEIEKCIKELKIICQKAKKGKYSTDTAEKLIYISEKIYKQGKFLYQCCN